VILDSTCSDLKRWPENADIRMDIKPEVKPDIVADAKHLPFRERVFDKIYCDPPHLIRNDESSWNPMYLRYGFFKSREDWLIFRVRTNIGFARCLKKDGVLHYKITDGKEKRVTKLRDLQTMTNFMVCSDTPRKVSAPWSGNTAHFLEMQPV
jgi:hypothetical protein